MANTYEKYILSKRMKPFRTFVMKFEEVDFSVHDEYELILVVEGSLDVKTQSFSGRLEEGDMVIINSYCLHSVKPVDDVATALIMQIQSDFVNEYVSLPSTKRVLFKNQIDFDTIDSKYFLMNYIRLHNKSLHNDISLDYQMNVFIRQLIDFHDRIVDMSNIEYRYIEGLNYLVQNIVIDLYEASDIAGHLSLSYFSNKYLVNYSYLSRLFRQEVGIGFQRYVQTKKINAAIVYLLNTDYSMKEIGQKVGYVNSEGMWKDFVQELQISPTEFRSKGREIIAERQAKYVDDIEKHYYQLRDEILEMKHQKVGQAYFDLDRDKKGQLTVLPFYLINDHLDKYTYQIEPHFVDRRLLISALAEKDAKIIFDVVDTADLQSVCSYQDKLIVCLQFSEDYVYTAQALDKTIQNLSEKCGNYDELYILVETNNVSTKSDKRVINDWISRQINRSDRICIYEFMQEKSDFNSQTHYRLINENLQDSIYVVSQIKLNFDEAKTGLQFMDLLRKYVLSPDQIYMQLNLVWDFSMAFTLERAEKIVILYLLKLSAIVNLPLTIIEINVLHNGQSYRIDRLHLGGLPTNFYFVASFLQKMCPQYHYDGSGLYYNISDNHGYILFYPHSLSANDETITKQYLDIESARLNGSYVFNIYNLDLGTSAYEYFNYLDYLSNQEKRLLKGQFLPDFEKRQASLLDSHLFYFDYIRDHLVCVEYHRK